MLETIFIDQKIFWLGFIAAVFLWWLAKRARPYIKLSKDLLSKRSHSAKIKLFSSLENRYRTDMLTLVQDNHILSPLFSLSEIAIEPRLMAVPEPVIPDGDQLPWQNNSSVYPYLPDWPEMAAVFGIKTLSLTEAVNSGQNLAIFGKPGIGKSFTLNYLCAKIAQRDPEMGVLADLIPLIIHVNDLDFSKKTKDPLKIIYKTLSGKVSILLDSQLEKYLKRIFKNKSVLLLIDGLDELPNDQQKPIITFIKKLQLKYPGLRLVVTLSTTDLTAIGPLELFPISLAAWKDEQKQEFYSRFGELWTEYVLSEAWAKDLPELLDPTILTSWLVQNKNFYNPFELSLITWAAYAGDSEGVAVENAIDAYIKRMLNSTANGIQMLEQIAQQMLTSSTPQLTRKRIQKLDTRFTQNEKSKTITALIESKIIKSQAKNLISFKHPILLAYLASCGLSKSGEHKDFSVDSRWSTDIVAREFFARKSNLNNLIRDFLDQDINDPLNFKAQNLYQWALNSSPQPQILNDLLRQILETIGDESLSINNRCRVLFTLVRSMQTGISELFRKLMRSTSPSIKIIGAFGSGLIRDNNAIKDIEILLKSSSNSIIEAACLALVAIDTEDSIDLLYDLLINASDDARHSAAAALALHPRMGYEYLKNGKNMENFSIRRATVFGLSKINEQWAKDALSDLRFNDNQWIVKSAAEHALETDWSKSSAIHPFQNDISDLPWLLSFSSEKGVGISPGQAGWDMLRLVLQEGNEQEKLGALDILRINPNQAEDFIAEIFQLFNESSEGKIKESAYNTLWHLEAMLV